MIVNRLEVIILNWGQHVCMLIDLGPVVRSLFNTNPGLMFNTLF